MANQNVTPKSISTRYSRRSFLKAVLLSSGRCLTMGAAFTALSEPFPSAGSPLSELRRGGCVVYVRHATTDRSRDDALRPDLADCATQRLLSPVGEEQSDKLGRALRALGIPVGQIFSSPYCRTLATARRAFPGHAITQVAELGRLGRTITNKVPDSCAKLKLLLATKPSAGENTFIVGHSDNLAAVGGPEIDEAGLAIFRPEKEGYKLVGTLRPPQWRALTQSAKDRKAVH